MSNYTKLKFCIKKGRKSGRRRKGTDFLIMTHTQHSFRRKVSRAVDARYTESPDGFLKPTVSKTWFEFAGYRHSDFSTSCFTISHHDEESFRYRKRFMLQAESARCSLETHFLMECCNCFLTCQPSSTFKKLLCLASGVTRFLQTLLAILLCAMRKNV